MIEYLLICLGLFALGSYKKDFTTLVFSGIGFILYGLSIVNGDVGFGLLTIGVGIYIALRTAIDLINYRRDDNGQGK